MEYVALLRGVNVGGKSTVSMPALRTTVEALGLEDVRTYINSGNVLFETRRRDRKRIARDIERAIESELAVDTRVLVRDRAELGAVLEGIPAAWTKDTGARCDVLFLRDAVDRPGIIQDLPRHPEVDEVRYVPGAVLWRIDPTRRTASRMARIVGTDLYRQMTIRNHRTVRKLYDLMEPAGKR